MQIDTAGTYTLKYTAEDACGNITEVEREVIAEQLSYRTVLYTDGTFIINEKSTDQAANEALHGVATNVYNPWVAQGTAIQSYNFTSATQRPWRSQAASIRSVEIGSNISPTSTRYWFQGFTNCTSMNLSRLNTSNVIHTGNMFGYCQNLTSLDITHFDTSNVGNMDSMFYACHALTALDVTHFDTSNVTIMTSMFRECRALTSLDVTHFNTSHAMNMTNMFYDCRALTSLDVANFDTSNVTTMDHMFYGCGALEIIYASTEFVVTQVTYSDYMFEGMSTNLVGGAGTTWSSSNPTDKTYAHIDGGISNPGYFTLKSA